MRGTVPLTTRRPAFGGTFNFDGRKIAHHADISWNELRTGASVIRAQAKTMIA
jgi:hypothetical protein